jgi:hypothetical protein
MRNLTSKMGVLIAVGVVALVSVSSAYAQTAPLRAHIPFQFRAADTVLPAGEYRVEMSLAHGRILIHPADGRTGLYLPAQPTQRAIAAVQPGMLVFHRYGNHHFLWKVWNSGQSQGYEVPRSQAEREMARTYSTSEVVSTGAGAK